MVANTDMQIYLITKWILPCFAMLYHSVKYVCFSLC